MPVSQRAEATHDRADSRVSPFSMSMPGRTPGQMSEPTNPMHIPATIDKAKTTQSSDTTTATAISPAAKAMPTTSRMCTSGV